MTDEKQTLRTIAPSEIPKHFDAPAAEQKWDAFWQEHGTYHWDPSRPREETFVVDTPPPTVSGSLHLVVSLLRITILFKPSQFLLCGF